ncbi:hypothetical protein [Methylobacterium nodulans]|uniref:hypothetical protein n=1 Tax=Methylobacterium nodulans TaxID=114616 RepID=UPI001FCC9AB1|nr:hypothetical protein [Methylobacterium nodulans]
MDAPALNVPARVATGLAGITFRPSTRQVRNASEHPQRGGESPRRDAGFRRARQQDEKPCVWRWRMKFNAANSRSLAFRARIKPIQDALAAAPETGLKADNAFFDHLSGEP